MTPAEALIEMVPDRSHDLAPGRGIMIAVLLCVPFWSLVALALFV